MVDPHNDPTDPSASSRTAAESALAAVAAIQSELKSLTEMLNKGAISYASDRYKTLDVTDIGHDEGWKHQALLSGINAKAQLDDALFDASFARKQLLRSVENTLNNQVNQYGQNNAMTLNGVDKLQNIDIREGAGAAEILRAAASIIDREAASK